MPDVNVIAVREKVRRVGFALRELVRGGARGVEHTQRLAQAINADPTAWLPLLHWDGIEATLGWWFHSRGLVVNDNLKASSTRAAAANLAALTQYREIFHTFKAAGIPVLPLKAVALAAGGYLPSFAARETSDVDCLIPEADREKTRQALMGIGFNGALSPPLPSEDPFDPFHDTYRRGDSLPVDVHWRLLPRAAHGSEVQDFWKNTVESTEHGIEVPSTRALFRHAILLGALARSPSAFSWRAVMDFIWAQGKDIGWGAHLEREFQLDVAWLHGNDAVEPTPVWLAPWRAWVASQPWPLPRQAEAMAWGIHGALGDAADVKEVRRQAWYLPPEERGGTGSWMKRIKQRLFVESCIRRARRVTG